MTVEIVAQSTPELVEAMERLIPQLSRSASALTAEQCEAFVAQEGVYLFVFRPDEPAADGTRPILGMLTGDLLDPHRSARLGGGRRRRFRHPRPRRRAGARRGGRRPRRHDRGPDRRPHLPPHP